VEIAFIITITGLVGIALILVAYPLWRQTRPDTLFRVNQAGQTLEEYEARYQATLAAIKDLMFDYEMGKVGEEDYELLLKNARLEAAAIRKEIDRLTSSSLSPTTTRDAEIETQVARTRHEPANDPALLQKVDAEIELLKNVHLDQEAGDVCPKCGQAYHPGDTYCSLCGYRLESTRPEPSNFCPQCGQAIHADDAFCARCGAELHRLVGANS
jgi:ribosomal protein S27AE